VKVKTAKNYIYFHEIFLYIKVTYCKARSSFRKIRVPLVLFAKAGLESENNAFLLSCLEHELEIITTFIVVFVFVKLDAGSVICGNW
jgi:hypothetical protein